MIVFLGIVAGVRKIRSLSRRGRMPMSRCRQPALTSVSSAELEESSSSGLDVGRRPAPNVLLLPARLLDRVAGQTLGTGAGPPDAPGRPRHGDPRVPLRYRDLRGADQGRPTRAAIASRLTRAPAWMTISGEAQAIEDESRRAHMSASADPSEALAGSTVSSASSSCPSTNGRPCTGCGSRSDKGTTSGNRTWGQVRPIAPAPPEARLERLVSIGYGFGVFVLLVFDVFLLLTGRTSSRQRRM